MKVSKGMRPSLALMATVMCAALYAAGSYATAFIPSPWGFGQFRPAVVIPSFFAVIFGPLPAGIGAAIGTLIADSVKHGILYEGSLIAAVPGNFIGFYLFGYIVKKKFTWGRFILATNLTLTIGNFIVAALYLFIFKSLYLHQLTLDFRGLMLISIGLTIWWFVTMLPFVLIVTPPLIRAVATAIPSVVPEQVKTHSLRRELPKVAFGLSMLIPGLIMILLGLIATYTVLVSYVSIGFKLEALPFQLLFYGSGAVLSILGFLVLIGRKFLR